MSTLSDILVNVTPRSATALVERCRALIDQDLAALAESMRVLHSRRNCLAHISCLPPEILVTVFRHFESSEDHTSTSHHRGAPICLILTHVCKHWRQLALDCPTLWTSVSCVSPRWLCVMLERSKDAHLVATYHAPVLLRGCLEPVLSHLSRIKILKICSVSADVDPIMELLSLQPAPSQNIRIRGHRERPSFTDAHIRHHLSRTSTLTSEHCICAVQLELDMEHLQWASIFKCERNNRRPSYSGATLVNSEIYA